MEIKNTTMKVATERKENTQMQQPTVNILKTSYKL